MIFACGSVNGHPLSSNMSRIQDPSLRCTYVIGGTLCAADSLANTIRSHCTAGLCASTLCLLPIHSAEKSLRSFARERGTGVVMHNCSEDNAEASGTQCWACLFVCRITADDNEHRHQRLGSMIAVQDRSPSPHMRIWTKTIGAGMGDLGCRYHAAEVYFKRLWTPRTLVPPKIHDRC